MDNLQVAEQYHQQLLVSAAQLGFDLNSNRVQREKLERRMQSVCEELMESNIKLVELRNERAASEKSVEESKPKQEDKLPKK